ncbi:MAG: glycosyltransferase family 4 protein [Bacteroidaceae bacterium]|nr:glycosyltransferase family 4 protein [Bacteroidaceae bacterium]
MKIAVEAQRIFRKNKHGMDFVVLEILRVLQQIDKNNEYWVYVAPGDDICLEETTNFHIVTLNSNFYLYWEQYLLPRAVRKIKPDLLHCTSNTAPLFPGVPLILTLHDIIFMEKKTGSNNSTYQRLGRIYRRFFVPKVLKKCRKVITVSNYEKAQIVASGMVNEERMAVIYNGFGKEFNASAASTDRNYILFLGSPDPKKNTPRTLEAYAIYHKESDRKLPLKVADLSRDNILLYLQEIGCPEIIDDIICAGYISHDELPATYGGAAAFLSTSVRESFGIPQLEAMACGTPAVVSNASALPEIAGQDAVLVDPYSPRNMADALLRLERDDEFREKSVIYGYERVKMFSWENAARQTLALYESEAGSN